MASFFDHQERARGRTGWLVILFVFGTLGITGCVTAIVAFAMPHAWFVAIPVGLGIVGVPFLCKLLSLGSDGASVALALGGVPLSPQASDPAERKVLNVVQEMAIASGMPIPRVYVLDEGSINAFAAGTGPESAVIGVSRGAIEQLTRDELQGVMAHEFSHIFHGDVKINMRAIAAIFGLLAIGYVGYVLLRGAGSVGRGARKGKEAVVVIAAVGLAFIVLGAIGTFFARLMQAAISRQREFLADASAVQYTRNPSGIAGALQKIMVQSDTRMDHAEASQFNHLFFAEGVRSWFASHPPLPSRIERIRAMAAGVLAAPSLNAVPSRSGSASSLAGIGTVTPEALGFASTTLATASEGNRVHDTASAWANILAALLSPESGRREVQRRIITERDPAIMPAIDALAPGLAAMSTAARLGVIELACATLRHDSGDGYESMRALMADVIRSDGRIELYEWVSRNFSGFVSSDRVVTASRFHHELRRLFLFRHQQRVCWGSLRSLALPTRHRLNEPSWLAHSERESMRCHSLPLVSGPSTLWPETLPHLNGSRCAQVSHCLRPLLSWSVTTLRTQTRSICCFEPSPNAWESHSLPRPYSKSHAVPLFPKTASSVVPCDGGRIHGHRASLQHRRTCARVASTRRDDFD